MAIVAASAVWLANGIQLTGAKDPRSQSAVITSHTSGLSLTAQQPVNNIVRGTTQAMALVMAGVQAIEISAFDEAYRTPSREAHLVGLRTQQVIDLEEGIGDHMSLCFSGLMCCRPADGATRDILCGPQLPKRARLQVISGEGCVPQPVLTGG